MGTHIWVVAALLAGAAATTPASEVAALRDFYGALGGDGWGTLTTVRMLIAIAVAMNLDLLHVDIPQAFVQSKIDAPVYLQLPNGVTVDKRHTDGRYDSRVVKLLRALYGLKQSPQLWNKELNT